MEQTSLELAVEFITCQIVYQCAIQAANTLIIQLHSEVYMYAMVVISLAMGIYIQAMFA